MECTEKNFSWNAIQHFSFSNSNISVPMQLQHLSFRLFKNMKKCICKIFTRISAEGFHFFCWLRKFRLGSSVQFENENSNWISRQYPKIWCWLWIPFLTHDTFFYSGYLFWPHVGKIDMANLTRSIATSVDFDLSTQLWCLNVVLLAFINRS